jgi:hypothetical protein
MSNAERNAEIVRRRLAGEAPRQMAREMGISHNVVAGVLNRAGIVINPLGGWHLVVDEEVRRAAVALSRRTTQQQAADAYGVSQAAVSWWAQTR